MQRKKKNEQRTRKEIRKVKRNQKKVNRFNYHNTKKNQQGILKLKAEAKVEKFKDEEVADEEITSDFSENEESPPVALKKSSDKLEQHIAREKQEENEYYDDIKKNRMEQLKAQNEDEEKIIGKYEKLLKLNKRKRKNGSTASASIFNDGLDYLLELCTDESIHKMYSAAKEVDQDQSEDYFGEDIKLALGESKKLKKTQSKKFQVAPTNDIAVESSSKDGNLRKRAEKLKEAEKKYFGDDEDFFNHFNSDSCEGSDSELDTGDETNSESSYDRVPTKMKNKKAHIVKFNESLEKSSDSDNKDVDFANENLKGSEDDDDELEDELLDYGDSSASKSGDSDSLEKVNDVIPEEWEDIYGRKRDKDGNIVKENINKYVPPFLRNALKSTDAEIDPKHRLKLQTLKRQIKGHVNRLAESNLHRVAIDIEDLYSSNARHDVNTSLTETITESLVSNVISAERIVLEQTLLIATLHANIGSEIGAFFLQTFVEKFKAMFHDIDELKVEDKALDNVIFIICHLYTYRLFKHNLIYEMLDQLSEKMTEKRIECTLLILRSIGFVLRKDDPLMLKEFIIRVQKLANSTSGENEKNSRVMFMLDILMALKNNNISKIPQHDSSLVEHFRKLLKQFVRPGKYVTTLVITMEDLLNANERGKWWLVGSAWAGTEHIQDDKSFYHQKSVSDSHRQKILALAKQQRMNTDDKKNIFYILMSAEDYMDAFEKIVATVKDERSTIAVIVHCCLSEKDYNPFYSVIAQKFCDHNRKYLLAIQFTVWDKIKDINSLSIKQVSNLARFLSFLIENENLPLSVLKVIKFNQIEKTTLRFLRQVMISLLLIDVEKFHKIFERIAPSAKLNPFKDQLRLFIKVFLMKDEKKIDISADHMKELRERMVLADKLLMLKHLN